MTPDELDRTVARLRRQGSDDALVEVKASAASLSSDVWESVCAFGNTNGGTIILGLNENDHFSPVKSFALERVRDQLVSGFEGGKKREKLANAPQYKLQRMDFEGAQVLVIEVSEVETRFKPCYLNSRGIPNGAYKRVDDKDMKLSVAEIFEMQHALEVSQADREVVDDASERDLDPGLVDSLIASEKERGSKAIRGIDDRQTQLFRLNVVNSQGVPRLAGILALGQYPQQFYPKLVVDVAAHPGIDKSDPDGPRFVDRVICEGPLRELIDEGTTAVARNLRTLSFVEGTQRHDVLEIPREVLREAIANAVIHREYGSLFIGQSVSVDVFSDRVEITNPGGLWGGKTLDNIADGQSRCRNSTLMKLMSSIQLRDGSGPSAEGQGGGIRLMIREMRTRALDEPRFEAGVDYFKVVLARGGAELSANRAWFHQVSDRSLERIEEAVLVEARRNGAVSVQRLHEQLGYDSDDLRAALSRLAEDGVLVRRDTDAFSLNSEGEVAAMTARAAILRNLSAEEAVSLREISDITGKPLATLRAEAAQLVREGLIEPTAPTTSRNRKYILPG